ncbi:hypothetical protein BDV93DRAFT_611774 [Ceratobasidium sp. AG-I]|nr:hypothetical protein BDV93DRAFT_611774 [Ceratobasidium sp. AG-I]
MAGQADTFFKLKNAIGTIPLIDNHAHNLLQNYRSSLDVPRETLVSFADGEALKDSVYSLAHVLMLKYLKRFFNLPVDSSWQTIIETAKARDYDSLCRELIQAAGIQAILIDDIIQNDHKHAMSWHDQLTPTTTKRLVGIETLFESIVAKSGRTEAFLFFPAAIRKLVDDAGVAGFKSIAAFRSGLNIQPLNPEELALKCEDAYRESMLPALPSLGKANPFHTGLGDNDITINQVDASLLQPLIKAYPEVTFVLLHSGYPYVRQAGYLATVYPNVYLDFGLAISLLSGDGQRSLIRQLLELCPTNKLLWSSGTAFHPERFYLGALQMREALTEILVDYVRRDELGFDNAIQVAKRMLFENSNKLYNLGIAYVELGSGKKGEVKAITKPPAPVESPVTNNQGSSPPSIPRPDQVVKASGKNISTLIENLKTRGIKFVRIAWVDYVNLIRFRVVSIEHFTKLVGSQLISTPSSSSFEQLAESGLSIIQAVLGLQANNGLTPGVSTSGDHDLKPDFSTLWNAPFAPEHAYTMGRFFHKGDAGGAEVETCPRTILQRVVQRAKTEPGVKFLVGFRTQFILLDQQGTPASTGAWSISRKLQCGPVGNCVHEMAHNVIDAGITLEIYHGESADGQYEMVTGPLPPTQAVDALIATREIIYNVAQKHNFRTTLCPRLNSHQAGTASHIHISVQSDLSDTPSNHPDIPTLPKDLASFMAGLLYNLASVCIFTLPTDASYARVVDGAWICWACENKEAPLRLCGSGQGRFNVDLKAFDGVANPYLGLAAVLGAGLAGLKDQSVLEMRDCQVVASELTEDQRREMRITTKMPTQNAVFEPGLDEKTQFVNTWLPTEAWKLYQDVRQHERDIILPETVRNASGPWTLFPPRNLENSCYMVFIYRFKLKKGVFAWGIGRESKIRRPHLFANKLHTALDFVVPMAEQANSPSKLKDAIDRIPLIDSNAHTLLRGYEQSPDLLRETLVSLADGEALKDSVYSLAHIRMIKGLARFFKLSVDSPLQTIIEAAKAKDYDSLCRDLVKAAGIQAILVDDGIQNDYSHAMPWRYQLAPTPNKRIACVETLFESIVAQNGRQTAFVDFPAAIRKLVDDPEVAGFKSIAACRSGLDVQPLDSDTLFVDLGMAFRDVRDYAHSPFRVDKHAIVTWLVNATCSAISGKGKPLQFHTG